jgi:hypothetical protein
MDVTPFARKIIKTDGSAVDYPPKGEHYTLQELKDAIGGGYIEIVHPGGDARYLMVLDEEGKIKGFPLNRQATRLYAQPPDYIVGDVLVCLDGDIE